MSSRTEDILKSILDKEKYTGVPQSRVEELLIELGDLIEQGGASPEQIEAAVDHYLETHPVSPYDDTEIRGEIATVKADLHEQSESLEALWKLNKGISYDFLNKVERGLSVNPAGAFSKSLLDVRGESRQESTNGYQLVDFSDYRISGSKSIVSMFDGLVSVDNSMNDAPSYVNFVIDNVTAGEYTLVVKDKTSANTIYIQNAAADFSHGLKIDGSVTLTTDGYLNLLISVGANGKCDFRAMVCKGSVARDWEPYTGGIPSPNPDYPQEITPVEEINICVSNRPYIDFIPKHNIESDGRIPDNYNQGYYLAIFRTNGIKTISGVVGFFTEYPEPGKKAYDNTRYLNTVNVPDNVKYMVVRGAYSDNSVIVINNVKYVMPTDPSDLEVMTKTITPPFALNGVGDVHDFADIDKGVWVKNIRIAIGDKSRFAQAESDGYGMTISSIGNSIAYSKRLCKYLTFDDKTTYSGTWLHVVDSMNLWKDATEFKEWMDGKEILYVTSEPTETPIDSADLDYLRSLVNLDKDVSISITDQNGQDISYMLEYIIKLSEVN